MHQREGKIVTELMLLREILSDSEHERWSRWQRYMFGRCTKMEDGSLVIHKDDVKHWTRQMETSYEHLSEKEKDSDRNEANVTISIVQKYLDGKLDK